LLLVGAAPMLRSTFCASGEQSAQGQRGRAKQMNFGASQSNGEILYFVNADAIPPKGYGEAILQATQEGFPIGCFRLKFDSK